MTKENFKKRDHKKEKDQAANLIFVDKHLNPSGKKENPMYIIILYILPISNQGFWCSYIKYMENTYA